MHFNSVVHIGAGKCGSTSLQSSLSHTPLLSDTENSQQYEYAVIRENGSVLRGAQLHDRLSPSGFSSVDLTHEVHSHLGMSEISNNIQAIYQENKIPILSCEGWLSRAHQFQTRKLLKQLSLNPKVVVYVRPPLEWINSAWWQWGAWLDIGFDEWLERQRKVVNWTRWIREWKALEGVASVEVRLATSDVVESFGQLLNVNLPKHQNVNIGSPPALLRFLQRHRQYRKGPHDNQIERYLITKLALKNEATPWVLSDELQVEIIDDLKESYNELLTFLPPREQQKMLDDARWWRAFSGEKRLAEVPGPIMTHHRSTDLKLSLWAKVYLLRNHFD